MNWDVFNYRRTCHRRTLWSHQLEHSSSVTSDNRTRVRSCSEVNTGGVDLRFNGSRLSPLDVSPSIAVDSHGNIFVAECFNQRILLLDDHLTLRRVIVDDQFGFFDHSQCLCTTNSQDNCCSGSTITKESWCLMSFVIRWAKVYWYLIRARKHIVILSYKYILLLLLWAPAQRKRATMLYFANVFFIYFLWPPYSPALVNGGSRKFHTWWTLSVIREVSSWIFS